MTKERKDVDVKKRLNLFTKETKNSDAAASDSENETSKPAAKQNKNKEEEKNLPGSWKVSLLNNLTLADKEIISAGLKALPRDKSAMQDYFRDSTLEIARRDIEKGERLKKAMKDLDR